MIITKTNSVRARDLAGFSWSGLRSFQNASFTLKKLKEYHNLPPVQDRNLKKQAVQIGFCIRQAEEYFVAANSVSVATKPLLLYYGIMSLALAEILLKQNGDSSLDRARGQNAHHGLTLKAIEDTNKHDSLEQSASLLKAAPLVKKGGERFGTFELWHRSSREAPLTGRVTDFVTDQNTLNGSRMLAIPVDKRLPCLSEGGISLLDCLKSIPDLVNTVSQHDLVPDLARGVMTRQINRQTNQINDSLIVHPTHDHVLDSLYPKFIYHPGNIPTLDVQDLKPGCIIRTQRSMRDPIYGASYPMMTQVNADEVIFFSANECLNEFGLFYVAMYILGNYARYFPDRWMDEIGKSSALVLATNELLTVAQERVPLLSLSEMSQTWHLVE